MLEQCAAYLIARNESHTAAAVASKVFAQMFGKSAEDTRPAEAAYAD